ncbi:MAG: glycosyl transferase family protein [Chloroflexi bacterium]|nr:MAG: glycosyl transferase family protein [Chloroflexota bacterium]
MIIHPLGIGLMAISLILLVGVTLAAGVYYAHISADLPSLDVLPVLLNPDNGELLQPTRIMDRDNQVVLFNLDNPGIERRYLAVNPDEPVHFNPQLIRAVVNKLDPTFWQNPGYSLENWRNSAPTTIAERLVSDLLLWDEPPSSSRPLRMRLLAAQVVSRFGRTQVLEWFLNSAYFGHRAYGAESAARLYFYKSAQDLTLAESAMLAVLIESPALNPLDAVFNTLELQRQFLADLTENQVITTEEFSIAVRQKLNLRTEIEEPSSMAPAFTHRMLMQLEPAFGQNRLGRGGLVILSSLDLELQTQFQCAAQVQMIRLLGTSASGFAFDEQQCQAALLLPTQIFPGIDIQGLTTAGLVMNPQNGEVLLYVEPTTFKGSRQSDTGYEPGSLLTPFYALAGFARGLSPASLKWDVPINLSDPSLVYQNPDGSYHGPVSIRSAVANDYLIPMVEVTNQVGTSSVWNLASALGFNPTTDESDPAAILFSGGTTTLLDIGSAYSTLANSGVRTGVLNTTSNEIKPNMVLQVITITQRIILDRTPPATSAVLSEPLAYLINNVLSDESARWPSLGYPNPLEIGQPVAAKIGQTSAKNQVWMVGYTPQRLALVWMGKPQTDQATENLDPRMAAGIWHAVIKMAVNDLPKLDWTIPQGIIRVNVCIPSGMLPSAVCPNTMEEVFLKGNEPSIADTLYQKIKVNRETGQRATVFTAPELIEDQIFINVPAEARQWAIDAGLAVAPSGYDSIPTTQLNPDVMIKEPVIFSPVRGKVTIRGTASGNSFSSYTVQIGDGINPASWQQIGNTGTTPVNNDELAVWNTTGLNGLFAVRLNVVDSNQGILSAVIQVTVDNKPPQVRITYPKPSQTIQPVRGSVTLSAEIQDAVGLNKVEWWVDGKLVSTQTNAPFVYIMNAVTGKHTLQIHAWDAAGNKTTSEKIQFSILK